MKKKKSKHKLHDDSLIKVCSRLFKLERRLSKLVGKLRREAFCAYHLARK